MKLWSCAAICADQTEREVVGLYDGDKCLLVSRPWRAPASIPVLQISYRRLYSVLSTLISAADYHVKDGIWYGEIAISWRSIAALTGLGQSAIYRTLKELTGERFIHYAPATGGSDATLIRVYPHNARTGVRLFQIDKTWLHGFELEIIPRLALYEVEAGKNVVKFTQLAPDVMMSEMDVIIGDSQVVVPAPNDTGLRRSSVDDSKTDEFLIRFKDVPGLDEIYRRNYGIDPDMGEEASAEIAEDVCETMANWREDGFSQRGIEVKIGLPTAAEPKETDLGRLPSWNIAAAAIDSGAENGQLRNPTKPSSDGSEAVGEPAPHEPSADSAEGKTIGHLYLCGSHNIVGVPSAKSAEAPRASACGAAAAPPPAAPPVASALFVMAKSERQLRQVQVDAIYRQRGARINTARRKRMSSKQVSCIETYERLSGVPFCAEDLPWLLKALTITSHMYVLRGISDQSSRYPKEDPGRYIFRDGMKYVYACIEASKLAVSRSRAGKRRASKAGSSRSASADEAIRKQREELENGPAPKLGMVSESTAGVPAETKGQPV